MPRWEGKKQTSRNDCKKKKEKRNCKRGVMFSKHKWIVPC
jgi:hypothetical protein